QKLWGFCHTLRHDGVDYGDYIEQPTYLLFLKMADERSVVVPKNCDWDSLKDKSGTALTDHYAEILRSWRYAALNKLCMSFDYGTSAKSQPAGDIPVVRMGNIQNGEIDWPDLVFTSGKQEIERYTLQSNTVLFNRTNSPELVGKTAIYRDERPAIFA